jgi:hypothetical protein
MPAVDGEVPARDAACIVIDADAADAADLVVVGVQQGVDPANAPVPQNDAERLAFAQVYETLVRVDCNGRVVAGLADSWSADEARRRWAFRLRPGAAFHDGEPATAATVAAALATSLPARGVAGVSRVDASGGVLSIELTGPAAASYFAQAVMAVTRTSPAATWAVGTGPFQLQSDDGRDVAVTPRAAAAGLPGRIVFRHVRNADPRAALDAGVDLLVTDDAAALDYAAAVSGYAVTPLMWSDTYVLATRAVGVRSDAAHGVVRDGAASPVSALPAEAFADLALHGSMRAAEPPFGLLAAGCRAQLAQSGAAAGATAPSMIGYPRGDGVARAIAERLAALAWPVSRTPPWLSALLVAGPPAAPPTVAALADADLADALRSGELLAAVLLVPRVPAGACARPDSEAAGALLADPAWQSTPVADVRQHLVHRRMGGRIVIDLDGTLRFEARVP